MTSISFFRHSTECPACGEESVAPERSEHLSTEEVHHFWCCSNCGVEFETLDHLQTDTIIPTELVRKFLPSLLVA
jgi:transcription elongation factor Elf1